MRWMCSMLWCMRSALNNTYRSLVCLALAATLLACDADNPAPAGIRIGDASAQVLHAYGARASVELHKYLADPAKYITVWQDATSQGERRGVRYEVDTEDRVARIHVGGASIEYVEGCL